MTVLKWYAEKDESGSWRRTGAKNFPPRVLVVEDNAINLELIVLLLEKTGCIADTATQGKKALYRIAEKDYDLVLMDLQMPVMDGLETVKAIRKMEGKKSRIPVIAFTAHMSEEERQNCLKNGMNDCMVKPITKEALLTLIQKYILHAGHPRENDERGEEKGQAPENRHESPIWDEQQSHYPVIDESVLLDFSDGDSFVIEKFIGLFMEESTKEVSLLEKALEERDITEVEKLAHSIKGAAAEVGGKRLSAMARNMEKAAENKDLVFCQAILEPLKAEWENVKKYLLYNFIRKEGKQPDDHTRKR
jgi:CheY-like chemotaxis protein/HPt (histidine-containing phosphotransfer) domain-containing protein